MATIIPTPKPTCHSIQKTPIHRNKNQTFMAAAPLLTQSPRSAYQLRRCTENSHHHESRPVPNRRRPSSPLLSVHILQFGHPNCFSVHPSLIFCTKPNLTGNPIQTHQAALQPQP
ncbi:hypothetical protein M0R45_009259 [Rubus argutus]|uniref:Uncharacterized protein n=1 Tax=Rubus argutus TaxID=59490 RepID=A0AAW1Y3E1_RUBAR